MQMMAVIFIFTAAFLTAATVISGSPATLTLERAFPSNHGIELNQLKARD
ncbi:aspartic proteinase-like protein 2-like, partial [Trifolium medium]|nr:aspartic proteinase-like protein 2-like [Trifolium medium]